MPLVHLARLPLVVLLVLVAGGWSAPPERAARGVETVRVRVLEQYRPASVSVRTDDAALAVYAGPHETPILELRAGEVVTFQLRQRDVFVPRPEGGVYARSLRIVPAGDAPFTLEVLDGAGPAGPRSYEGVLSVSADADAPGTLKLINAVRLESYVAGVVAKEYGLDDVEGSKAMAVVARTYALSAARKFGDDYDHVDHVLSQMYDGVPSDERALAAARATAGEVLLHDGALIEATYFSSSGGHTADNETVWDGVPRPYLRGKPDPYDAPSPHASWTSTVDRARLLRVLSERFGFAVEGFLIDARSDDGRVQTVQLLGPGERTVPSNAFRLAVNHAFGPRVLRSTLFDARRDGDRYRFDGRGFGHGVGMSQWGAHEMARQGFSYRDILSFYYGGVTLARVDALDADALRPVADAPRADDAPPVVPRPTPTAEAAPPRPLPATERSPARPDTLAGPRPTAWSTPAADSTAHPDAPPQTTSKPRKGW